MTFDCPGRVSFSVIMPTLRKTEEIIPTISSISLASKDVDCLVELVIVADGSALNEEQIKNLFPDLDIFVIRNKSRLGPGVSRNIGFLHSRHDNICFVDSDDIVSPAYFQCLSNAVHANKIFTSIQFKTNIRTYQDGELKLKTMNNTRLPGHLDLDYVSSFLSGNIPCECWQIVISRNFYESSNISFMPGLHEDVLFWYNLCQRSYKPIFIDDILYTKVETKNSIVQSISSQQNEDYLNAINEILCQPLIHKRKLLVPILNVIGSRLRRIDNQRISRNESILTLKNNLVKHSDMLLTTHFCMTLREAALVLGHKTRFEVEFLNIKGFSPYES